MAKFSWILGAGCLLGMSGCDAVLDRGALGSSDDVSNSDGSGASDSDPLGIGCDIQAVMARDENSCTASGCHGARPEAGLDLLSEGVAERLVGVSAQGESCGGEPLINVEDPENSLLLRKIDPARFGDGSGTCGDRMPLGPTEMSDSDLECFEKWVMALAETTEPDGGVSYKDEWEDASPESQVSKVKTLVTGEAVLATDIEQVRKDPAALSELVKGWVETPAFERKLYEFLEVALQQRFVGDLTDQADGLNFASAIRTKLQNNVVASFTRTAQRLVLEGRPFNEIATTTEWDMTTALLALVSFTEYDDTEKRGLQHWVYKDAPPVGAPATTPTLNQSINSGFWHFDDLPAACDGQSVKGSAILDFLYGRVGCGVGQAYTPEAPVINDADYADWRPVKFTSSKDKTARIRFWDIPELRQVTTLATRLPRVGFFSTPAFLANWPTNEDNQFRVTASQTMITALGKEFYAGDETESLTLAGLAEEHAEPTTTCYSCHTKLDPMRNYFTGPFDFSYQVNETPTVPEAGLAFRGEASKGGDVYDFASTVAGHPLFGAAWVQKLCFYANSQACDETDPEFLRVVALFEESGFDFKTLVIELFGSPLVSGASYTQTYDSRRFLISITRQNHLCPRLDAHLGMTNVCGEGSSFIGLIPEDEFARGQADPVQTAVTGAFHYAAVDALCKRLATRLVGDQSGRPFGLTDEAASLDLMAGALLGLPAGHSRRESWGARLSAHYQAARDAGASKSSAMQSAFTLSCTSPEVMAIGL